jgi:hypothetical protein
MNILRRYLQIGALAAIVVVAGCAQPANAGSVVTVYMTPTCGCCKYWADHMRENGFTVQEVKRADLSPIRAQYGVPGQMISCHTAVIDGYAIEGHVPADAVRRLLRERPTARGIAVPGMPIGSPGMEQIGYEWDAYNVYLISEDGRFSIYERRIGGDH